jgi:hypothetical protein
VIHTIVFFGASSSQSVHPERMSIDDLAAAAVARILAEARDLVLASSRAGGRLATARNSFALAKEKLDKHEVTPALAAVNAAILSVAQPGSPLAENVRDGFDLLVAACAAEAAGVDTRHAQDIYEAAGGEMGEAAGVFAESWKSLNQAVRQSDGSVRARLGNLLKALHAPQKALELVKEG